MVNFNFSLVQFPGHLLALAKGELTKHPSMKGGNQLTKNQLDYQRNLEQERSNRANEAETARSNKARERETNRSNVAQETEKHRSALINENQARLAHLETVRSNKEKENLNRRSQAEVERTNVKNEGIKYRQYLEQARHNVAVENETNRANLAHEFETNRSNVANEDLRSGELSEKIRSNKSNEYIKTETNRINEDHFVRSDAETNRHNLAYEGIEATRNALKAQEIELGYAGIGQKRDASEIGAAAQIYAANTNAATRYADIAEQARHNLSSEALQEQKQLYDYTLGYQRNEVAQREADIKKRQYELQSDQWYNGQKSNVMASTAALRGQESRNQSLFPLQQAQAAANIGKTVVDTAKSIVNIMNPISSRGGKP